MALFDTGANSNCILEGLVPTKFFEKTSEKLSIANGSKLKNNYKLSSAIIENTVNQMLFFFFLNFSALLVVYGTPPTCRTSNL